MSVVFIRCIPMDTSLYAMALHEYDVIRYDNPDHAAVWDWIRAKIDFVKFRNRVIYADTYPTKLVKVVLMEYSSTWNDGDAVTRYRIPETCLYTDYLDTDGEIMDYLNKVIAHRNPNVQVYTRRKIVDGYPSKRIRQLVVSFNGDRSTDLPSPGEQLDEELQCKDCMCTVPVDELWGGDRCGTCQRDDIEPNRESDKDTRRYGVNQTEDP